MVRSSHSCVSMRSKNRTSKTHMHPNIPCSTITLAENWSTQSVRKREMEQDVVCLYNGIQLSHKTEWTNAFVSNIDGPGDDCTKWRKSYRVGWKA